MVAIRLSLVIAVALGGLFCSISVEPVQSAPQAAAIPQDSLQWAVQASAKANDECRARRLRGELKTYEASVQCSNPIMIAAFTKAKYRYMDLIDAWAEKRLELAKKLDRGELTEQQVETEGDRFFSDLQAIERQRNFLANQRQGTSLPDKR